MKKGNKKMPIPRQKVIDNPIPTSLIYSSSVIFGYSAYHLTTDNSTFQFICTNEYNELILKTKMSGWGYQ